MRAENDGHTDRRPAAQEPAPRITALGGASTTNTGAPTRMSPIWRLSGARPARAWLSCAVLLLALALSAVRADAALAADNQVIIVQPSDQASWRYDPSTITVRAGTSVTWVNQGSVPMTVTFSDRLFDSDEIAPGGSYSTTLDTPGTFRYFCVPYPHMKGVVVVTR